jgi:hypothetical protein
MDRKSRIRVGRQGRAALLDIQAFAVRYVAGTTNLDEALDLTVRFIHAVDPHTRDGILMRIAPSQPSRRLSIPGQPDP